MNAARHSNVADDPADDRSDEQRRSHRVRFELVFASLWLAFGLFLLPALIFWVGGAVLGAYGENAGLGTFYSDFFGDLADTSGRAWTLALGPLLLMYLLRAIFIGMKTEPDAREEEVENERPSPARRAPPAAKDSPAKKSTRPARVEPRMGRD